MFWKTAGKSYNKLDPHISSTHSYADPQDIATGKDTLKIQLSTPELNIPETKTTSKLRQINEKIREIDPREEIVSQTYEKPEPVTPDTVEVALYDKDTIPYLTQTRPADKAFSTNYFYNIPDFKPLVQLVDTAGVVKQDGVDAKPVVEPVIPIQFSQSETIIERGEAGDKSEFNAGWIPVFLIVLFVFIAWIRVFYNKVLRLTLRSAYNNLIANRLFREKNTLTLWGGFVLNVLFFLTGGFFIYLAFTYLGFKFYNQSGMAVFGISTAVLLMFVLFKVLVIRIVGLVFKENSGAAEYVHNIFIFNRTMGVFMLPLVAAVPYIPEPGKEILIKAGIVFMILLYLLSVLRGIRLGIKINISIYYMILYLCTLEFFPLLILYKLFINYTSLV